MASIAALMRLFRLTDRENSTPSATQVVITFLVPNIESPRTMIVPQGPQARAVPIACLSWPAAAQSRLGDHRRRGRRRDGGDLRGQAQPQQGAAGDLGVPERGALFVVPVD